MHQVCTIEGDPCHRFATLYDGSSWLQHAPCLCAERTATIDGQTTICTSWQQACAHQKDHDLAIPDRHASVNNFRPVLHQDPSNIFPYKLRRRRFNSSSFHYRFKNNSGAPWQRLQRYNLVTDTLTLPRATKKSSGQASIASKLLPASNPTQAATVPIPSTSKPPINLEALYADPEQMERMVHEAVEKEESIPANLQVKETIGKYFGLMYPRGLALEHEAAPLLKGFADNGCPVDCGENWTDERVVSAMLRGPHQSAYLDGAVGFLQEETKEKVRNGFARVIKWGDIKDNVPPKLKISPVAMVPHKSKKFRVIMDLSFRFSKKDGSKWESVNSATTKLAPQQSMAQLGLALKRMVATMADNFDPDRPFKFAKLDIKDGFWRMAVNDENAWNFVYVLPSENKNVALDDIELVVPNSLQMGWCESPPFFCAGSETARDVIEELLPKAASLPPHPLENKMLDHLADPESASDDDSDMSISSSSSSSSSDEETDFVNPWTVFCKQEYNEFNKKLDSTTFLEVVDSTIMEVFVDDFMAGTNNLELANLRNISRAMLHGIHTVFPPPEVTGHQGGDPISVKKIENGDGHWLFKKEILGWQMNGKKFTIQLPQDKKIKILEQLRTFKKYKFCPLNAFQKLAGRLQHASFALPGGYGLFSEMQKALVGSPKYVTITDALRECFRDFSTIIKQVAKIPTHVLQLVHIYPDFLGYNDACKLGAGGVWFGITEDIGYIVWRVKWPDDIANNLVTWDNPTGKYTMNDLELAGVVLEWLVLECLVPDLIFKAAGMNCDNTTSTAWATKFRTAKSAAAAKLLRLLAFRMYMRKAAPAMTIGVAGIENDMADVASRSFKDGGAFIKHMPLLTYFQKNFPLPQGKSWKEFHVPSDLLSRVISCVRGEALPMASLLRLKKAEVSIGNTGAPMPNSAVLRQISKARQVKKSTSSSQVLLHGSGRVTTDAEIKSKFLPSLKRSRPSARPSSWVQNRLRSTEPTTSTTSPSNDASKV